MWLLLMNGFCDLVFEGNQLAACNMIATSCLIVPIDIQVIVSLAPCFMGLVLLMWSLLMSALYLGDMRVGA